MTSPVDEYLMEKTALFGISASKAKELAGSTAIQFGVGAAIAAAPAVAQKVMGAITKRHNFNQMLGQNPDLAEARADDPKTFNNFYNSFHRLNPEFASDPTVSGTYMRQMMAHPEGAGKVIVESLRGREGFGTPFGDALRSGASTAAKSFPGAFTDARKPEDPFAVQRQRVEGLGLQAKERDLDRTLSPPPTSYQDQLRKNLDDMKLEMEHQDVMTRAYQRGMF